MAYQESSYQIRMVTTADTKGVAEIKTGIEGISAALKQLQTDIAVAERTGVSVPQEARQQLSSLQKQFADLGRSAHEAGEGHKVLHESIHLAGIIAGETLGPIGELAHFLANPYILATFGATAAIKMLVEQHEKLRETAIKNLTAMRDQAEAFRQGHVEALQASQDALNAWNIRLEHARDGVDLMQEAMRNHLAILSQTNQETQTLAQAQNALTNARIQGALAEGAITDTEADRLTRTAALNERRARDAADDAQHAGEIEGKRKLVHDETIARDRANQRLPQERADSADKDEAIRDNQKLLDQETPIYDAAKEAAKGAHLDLPKLEAELKRQVADIQERISHHKDYSLEALNADRLRGKISDAKTLIATEETEKKRVDSIKGLIEDHQREKAAIDALVTRDTELVLKKNELIESTQREIDQLTGSNTTRINSRTQVEGAQDETTRVRQLSALQTAAANGTASPDQLAELGAAGELSVNEIRDRMRRGEATPEQINAANGGAAGTADYDLADAARKAAELERKLKGERVEDRSPADMAALHTLLDKLIGFSESQNEVIRRAAARYSQLEGRVQELITTQQQHDYILHHQTPTRL